MHKRVKFKSAFLLLSSILWFLTNEILQKTCNATKSPGKNFVQWSFIEALRTVYTAEKDLRL